MYVLDWKGADVPVMVPPGATFLRIVSRSAQGRTFVWTKHTSFWISIAGKELSKPPKSSAAVCEVWPPL